MSCVTLQSLYSLGFSFLNFFSSVDQLIIRIWYHFSHQIARYSPGHNAINIDRFTFLSPNSANTDPFFYSRIITAFSYIDTYRYHIRILLWVSYACYFTTRIFPICVLFMVISIPASAKIEKRRFMSEEIQRDHIGAYCLGEESGENRHLTLDSTSGG